MWKTATLSRLWVAVIILRSCIALALSSSELNLTDQAGPPFSSGVSNISSVTNPTDGNTACYDSFGTRQPVTYADCIPLQKAFQKFHPKIKLWILNPTHTSIPFFRSTGYLKTPWTLVKDECQMTISRLGPDENPESMQKAAAIDALENLVETCTGGSPHQAPQGPWQYGGMIWFARRKVKIVVGRATVQEMGEGEEGEVVVAGDNDDFDENVNTFE